MLSSNDEVILAVERRAEQRRLEEHAAELRKLEMAEAERLKGERERLRNRFKDGSLDAEGVDPLALRDDEGQMYVPILFFKDL